MKGALEGVVCGGAVMGRERRVQGSRKSGRIPLATGQGWDNHTRVLLVRIVFGGREEGG
jgi:hypothetical protein